MSTVGHSQLHAQSCGCDPARGVVCWVHAQQHTVTFRPEPGGLWESLSDMERASIASALIGAQLGHLHRKLFPAPTGETKENL